MSTDNRFDEPALNVAQKIIECQATAAVDSWPDGRLKAAIQCLVIEAMKWAAPALTVRGQVFIDGNVSGEAMKELLAAVSAVPEGWKLVPGKLTAENGAKAALMGEFKEEYSFACPEECFADEDCETCDGSGRIHIEVPVSWTTIKEIWVKGVEHFNSAAPAPGGEHG